MERFIITAMEMAKPDWTVQEVRNLANKFNIFYVQGVMGAALKVEAHGKGDKACNDLAAAIRDLATK